MNQWLFTNNFPRTIIIIQPKDVEMSQISTFYDKCNDAISNADTVGDVFPTVPTQTNACINENASLDSDDLEFEPYDFRN